MTDHRSQPICATPPADLLDLAAAIAEARDAYLNALEGGQTQGKAKAALEHLLWNDKGTFAPALRQAAEVATIRAKVDELTAALRLCRPEIERQRDRCNSDDEVAPYEDMLAAIDAALAVYSQHSDGEAGR